MQDYATDAFITDQYRIVDKVGEGGFGIVYKVEDVHLGIYRALKVLKDKHAHKYHERLQREWRALASLEHPHIVPVVGAGYEGVKLTPYLVMPLLKGDTLRSVLSTRGALGLERTFAIVSELLDALSAAHRQQIIHRDVKPENIFLEVNRDGRLALKLIDFGIMRVASHQSYTSSLMLGTARYMAPELFDGEKATEASNLYAVGVLMYEALAGEHPHEGTTNIVKAHRQRVPTALHERCNVPEDISDYVDSLLDKDRMFRISSAERARDRLEALRDRRGREHAAAPPLQSNETEVDGVYSFLRHHAEPIGESPTPADDRAPDTIRTPPPRFEVDPTVDMDPVDLLGQPESALEPRTVRMPHASAVRAAGANREGNRA